MPSGRQLLESAPQDLGRASREFRGHAERAVRDWQQGVLELVRSEGADKRSTARFLAFLQEFLTFTVPAYIGEGKTRLTLAIGCTGGFHRSIAIGEALAVWLREQDLGPVAIFHRELDRP